MNTLLNLIRTALCAGLAAAALAQPAAATTLARTKSFEGNINFVGTQASLQSKAGGAHVCDLVPSAQAGITLPTDASVVSASLYWTATGAANRDTEVLMNGVKVSAPADRRYSSSLDGFSYFSAAADVTTLVQGALVQNKASFSFGGLDADVSATYCAKQQKENTMVAGFALVVVYAHKDERYRTVNVYEGLQAMKYGSVTVPMPDYMPAAGNTGSGRLGYIVWEGDKSGNQKDDYVEFAGEVLRGEPYIQKKNAFNSKSGANGDENSLGIDFDIVDLPGPPATPADAKAVFTTGSDRVLLGTAIVALPSAVSADLAIRKSQAGDFKPGSEITYTLDVVNQGTRDDSAVTVTDTLPGALTYVSASGADWSCTLSGQTVTCKYGKSLAPNGKASVKITARITGDGKIVNTATVSGTADGIPGNDSSKVEGNVSAPPTGKAAWVFTAGKCEPGETIKPAGEAGCAHFQGPVIAGSEPGIYLTRAVDGVAVAPDPAAASTVMARFSLECNNPAATARTAASYAGTTLNTCVNNGTKAETISGTSIKLDFEKGAASVKAAFHYPDVGIVTLRMLDGGGNLATTGFASVPAKLGVVYKREDGVLNPGVSSLTNGAFAEAGEPFVVAVAAYGLNGTSPLPNFGHETGDYALAGRLRVLVADGELEQKLLVPQDGWKGAGSVERTYVWNEAGMARLGIELDRYLGTDKVLGIDPVTVGRFYPQYFKTETEDGFACLKRMKCPEEVNQSISHAIFSRQPFKGIVRAYGRNGVLTRFTSMLVPEITLSAVSASGPDGKDLDKLVNGNAAASTEREVSFGLANGYAARTAARDWTPPTALYLRATASELRAMATGTEVRQITSQAMAGREGGIMVVNGRLFVGNVIGNPLARTSVPLRAQYWSGLAWEQNSGIEQTEAVLGKVDFSACRRSLRLGVTGDACDPAIVKVFGAQSGTGSVALPMLKEGKASLILAPVGNNSGNVDVFINAEETLPFLPSTVGRVSFGQFKSPVIYVREMY